ncbi:MAG: hypothetical protein HYV33_00990 [Candidatus Kerfeldbacteria bacterium]|nr:hypothetical protein [Candidatus Kerfeldbacteria bacterium]
MVNIDLTKPEVYQDSLQFLQNNIVFADRANILDTDRWFQAWFANQPSFRVDFPEQAKEIDRRLIESRWVALPVLENPMVLDLFQQHLTELMTLQEHYDLDNEGDLTVFEFIITERLREKLVDIRIFEERDAFKKQLVEALSNNDEVITSAKFFRGLRETRPTTRHWLAEYIEYMGPKFSVLRQNNFFRKNDNALKLSSAEQHRLTILFKVYEQLKISSWRESGVEETIPYEDATDQGVIKYGQLELYDQKKINEFHESVKNYKQLLLETGSFSEEDIQHLMGRGPVAAVVPKGPLTNLPGPDLADTAGPDHFTDQDAQTVTQLAVQSVPLQTTIVNYNQHASNLKQQLQLTFATPELEKKFTDLLISVLRGLRDVMEFRQYLVELQYPLNQIEAIVAAIKGGPIRHKAAVAPVVTPPAIPAVLTKQPAAEVTLPANVATPPAIPKRSFLPKLRRSRMVKKALVDDVKLHQTMIMGPIDELRAMDVIEFRRLSPDPAAAATKLRDKIELLGEESIIQQADGIKAFRESPLNLLYLDIGNRSIATGQSVADVIAELQHQGAPTLTLAEFNAMADLNRTLRF